jgi:hypothetical protein
VCLMVPLFTLSTKGKDATEAFEDVGHSEEARELLPGMIVGEFETGPNVNPITSQPSLEMYSPPQEVIAKAYLSQSAAAASMDNAVEQTSKSVPTTSLRIPYSSHPF